MRRRLAIVAVIVLAVYWAGLFVATHVPEVPDVRSLSFKHADKVAHTIAYAVLAWLAAMVLRVMHWPLSRICLAVFTVCAAYGAVDEWLQQYTQRNSSFSDWIADIIGAALGLMIFLITHQLIRRCYLTLTGQDSDDEP